MDVTLKPELETFIAAEVKSGRASDAGDFLSKAVYHYVVARDLGQEFTQEEIDNLIAEGLDDIDRGDTVDGEEAFRRLREHSAERRRQRV